MYVSTLTNLFTRISAPNSLVLLSFIPLPLYPPSSLYPPPPPLFLVISNRMHEATVNRVSLNHIFVILPIFLPLSLSSLSGFVMSFDIYGIFEFRALD